MEGKKIITIFTPDAPSMLNIFCQAKLVPAGCDTLYVSGQIAVDLKTM